MAPGFRHSQARPGGRSVVALLIAVTLSPAGLIPGGGPAGRDAAAEARAGRSVADLTAVADAAGSRTTAPAADLARFDRAPRAGVTAGAPTEAAPATADAEPDAAGLQPSIQYEEAVRHANDQIAFTPGGRVTVGFTPRPGDTWSVGGRAPTALPAGRLDGKTIRGQAQGQGPDADRDPGAAPADDPAAPAEDPAPPAESTAPPAEDPTTDAGPDATVDLPSGDPSGIPATDASAVVPSDPLAPAPEARVNINGLRKEIFGFLPYWEVNSSTLRLDYSKISTIAYFGVGADATGNLQKRNSDGSLTVGWSGWTSSKMTSIISAAHSTHTRVVLTVQSFGWSTAGLTRQKSLLSTATRRLNLARQIAAAVRDRGVDGVNLDFEPLASGYEAAFSALVRTIRTELNRIHTGYQITFDTLGSIGNYPIENATASGGADAIFVMGYDYRTAGSSPVGSIAPLDRPGYGILDTVLAYTARVPASKVILGVPYYGRAWSTATDALHATNTSGTKFGASTTVVYDTAADYLTQYGRRYDPTEQVAWTAYRRENCTSTYGCVTSWRQLYVDDAAALGAKYDLVNRYGLRGAGIWALGYDGTRTELWAAIQRKFVTDTTPPAAGIVSLPARQVNPAFTVTWTGRDDVAVKSYDVQVSTDGGAWLNWRLATTATSAAWAGFDNHTYAFRVRARDLKGNLGAWNVASTSVALPASLVPGTFATVLADSLTTRSAAGVDAAQVGTFDSGSVLAVIGGPVAMDGFTWLRVIGPLTAWGPVGGTSTVWVASSGGRLGPAKAPNATRVAAALGDLSFDGAGAASIGTSAAAAAHRAFSPNGNGSRDTLAIDWTADRAFDSVALRVFNASGTLLGNVPVAEVSAGDHEVRWDGRVGGTLLPDGQYLVSLVGAAGGIGFANPGAGFNATALALYGVRIDRVAPVITGASGTGSLLSPNGDGVLDSVAVALSSTGSDRWWFSAAPLSGSTVGASVTTRFGSGSSARVTWTGRSDAGAVVPDGLYRLTLTAGDAAGNRVGRSWTVRVDATPATLNATATPGSISPDGDGLADSTRIAWTSSERITGSARLFHGSTYIRSWTVAAGTSGAFGWTGTTSSGTRVADGTYTIKLTGLDAAGNRTTRSLTVVVDRTVSGLRWSRTAFYPQDGDAIAPTSRVSFTTRRSAKVSVAIYQGSTRIRTIWVDRTTLAGSYGWTWDGRNDSGAVVPRGTYTVQVTARSWVGTQVLRRSVLADAFRTTLSATSLKAGQTLTITFSSIEPLRANPTVSLTEPGRAAITKTASAIGSGVYRVSFVIASGPTGAATIRIAGRDTAGGTNATLRTITIR